jgi:hypothetical protein
MLNTCIEAVDLLLDAIYSTGERHQLLSEFGIHEPNSPIWSNTIGTSIYIRNEKTYLKAVFYIKQNGVPYLSELPISKLKSQVTQFLIENFWYIRDGEFSRNPNLSYKLQIPCNAKLQLAKALLTSPLFKATQKIFLYPFNSIHTESNLRLQNFFIVNSSNLSLEDLNISSSYSQQFNFNYYPSLIDNQINQKRISTWIGIYAPTEEISQRILYALLGVISLFEDSEKRYCFNGEPKDSGCSYFPDDYQYTCKETVDLLPSLYFKLKIGNELSIHLNNISNFMSSINNESERYILALTNFYKSWFEQEAGQYRTLCTCIESLIEDTRTKSSQKFKNLCLQYSNKFDSNQLSHLLNIRGSIVHGKAPHLSDSSYYDSYLETYLSEPLTDLLNIVEIVLKSHIFRQ